MWIFESPCALPKCAAVGLRKSSSKAGISPRLKRVFKYACSVESHVVVGSKSSFWKHEVSEKRDVTAEK